ncbi:MAG: glycosyltransferase, partial [Acidobacteriota bacterium]
MRAVLTNFGSTGDIQPFLALAIELRNGGHQPILACSPNFRSMVERLELEFVPIGPDLQKIQCEINETWMAMPATDNSTEQIHSLFTPLISFLPQAYEELSQVSRNADVLISGPVQPAARMVHEITGIPFVSVQISHLGGIGTPALQQASAALINPFRKKLGLPFLRDPLTIDANSPQLALYAISRHFCPLPNDWPAHYHMIGFFFLDDEQWQPDARLVEFITTSEPPIVITFGSVTYDDPDQFTNMILDAITLAGCRAIIQQGWSGLAKGEMPPNVLSVGYVPHSWLFPRAACIVHHGGIGTTAWAFKAGVPSIFIPHIHMSDQIYWAEFARELGCSGPAIHYQELGSLRLADAIKATLFNTNYYRTVAALGEKISDEQGVKKARQLIEQLVYDIGLYQRTSNWQTDLSPQTMAEKVNKRRECLQKQRSR